MTITTIYFNDLMLEYLKGNNYTPLTPTLNHKFDIINSINNPQNPTLKYLAIGVGGIHSLDNNGQILNRANHFRTDGALFKHIPFRLVLETSDLDLIEQKKYRFRKIETINNVRYVGYYLKVLDTLIDRNNIFKIDSQAELKGVFRDTDILNPDPNRVQNGDRIVVDYRVDIELSELEIEHIKEGMSILGYTENHISEWALCSGFDYEDEAYNVQPMMFLHTDYNINTLVTQNSNISVSVDIGGMDLCHT